MVQSGEDRGQIQERRSNQNMVQFGEDRGQIKERRGNEDYKKTMDREDSEVSQRTCSPLTSAGVEHCEKLEEAAVMAYAPQWSPRVSPHGGVFTQQQLKSQESLESECKFKDRDIPNVNFKEHQSIAAKNEVDSWIEQLDPSKGGNPKPSGVNQDFLMTWFIQQHLPKAELPKFGGVPLEWVEFIMKFRDIIHNQYYLTYCQRL